MEQVPFDQTDPIAVAVAWLLTSVVSKTMESESTKRFRTALPLIAVLSAVGFRAAYSMIDGQPISLEMMLRALAAGAVAVFSHSQLREFIKVQETEE